MKPVPGHLYKLFSKAISISKTDELPKVPAPSDRLLGGQEVWAPLLRAERSQLFGRKVKSETSFRPKSVMPTFS